MANKDYIGQKFATFIGHTDRQAYEVLTMVSTKCLEVRRMKATLLNGVNSGQSDALQFAPGGFCGHTSGEQRYDFQPDTSIKATRIRQHKNGYWYDRNGSKFILADKPYEHYDYNY